MDGRNAQVSYQWRLREVMAAAGLFNASDLEPLLADRGITLSSVQVRRLVTQTPERLSLPVLAALCDIFGITPAQLIATRAESVPARRPPPPAGGGCRRRPERAAPGPGPAASWVMTQPAACDEADDVRSGAAAVDRGPAPGAGAPPPTGAGPRGTSAGRCLTAALAAAGTCPGCGDRRLLPGRGPTGRGSAATAPASPREFRCLRRCTETGMAGGWAPAALRPVLGHRPGHGAAR